jgi:hypothetical protein
VQVLVDALRKTKSGAAGRARKRQRTARRSGEPWTSGDNDDSDTQSGDSSYEYGACGSWQAGRMPWKPVDRRIPWSTSRTLGR